MRTTTGIRRTSALSCLLVAMLAAACSSTSPRPSATASASPVDVVAAFEAIVNDPGFSGRANGTGTFTLNAQAATITTTTEWVGTKAHVLALTRLGDEEHELETISIGAKSYAKRGEGPWVAQTGEITAQLPVVLRSLPDLRDNGSETVNGRELHHLTPSQPESLDMAALLGMSSKISGAQGTIDIFVQTDGTPVLVREHVTFTQSATSGSLHGEMIAEFVIETAPPPEIQAPAQIWETHASTALPYSVAYPARWAVEPSSRDASDATEVFRDRNRIVQGCNRIVVVKFYPSASGTAADWFSNSANDLTADGSVLEVSDSVEVAGFEARVFGLHSTVSGCGEVHLLQATFLQDGRGWALNVLSPAGDEGADREVLDLFLLTFEPQAEPASGGPQGSVRLADVPVGTCFDPGTDYDILGWVSIGESQQLWFGARDAVVVDCAEPHGYEVLTVIPAGSDRTECDAEFAAYVGRPISTSALGYVLMIPHDDEQASGIPLVCAAFSPAGPFGTQPMTGSVKNSNR